MALEHQTHLSYNHPLEVHKLVQEDTTEKKKEKKIAYSFEKSADNLLPFTL